MAKYLNYEGLSHLIEKLDAKFAPISAIEFKSTVADIAHLPTLNTQKAGFMYNITTGGITTSDFVEGAGHIVADGENVAAVEFLTGEFTAVPAGQVTDAKDPKALNWYEFVDDEYIPSTDRIADTTKTYYTANSVIKWDLMGGVFDLESRYLEFGAQFPANPVNDRVFLYMGPDTNVYTAVNSPSGRPNENGYYEGTFTEVADQSTIVNPKQEGLYEQSSNIYVHSSDIERNTSKTYYSGAFIASTDTTVDVSKTYYTKASQYKHAVIYQYDSTLAVQDWVAQTASGTDDLVPITTAEIDELFI